MRKFNLKGQRDNDQRERQTVRRNNRQFKSALQSVGVVVESSEEGEFFKKELKKLSHG